MVEPKVPASLLNQVRASIEPVRPLSSPSQRLLALMPLVAILFFGPPMYYGWRENLSLLPVWASWGGSAIESFAGVLLMGLALRHAVPGCAVPVRWMWAAFVIAALLFAAVTLTTSHALPTPLADDGSWPQLAWECVFMELAFALPALCVSAWLVGRALPERPALTGGAYGLAISLMTDAGLRLFCAINEPLHLFAAHGGAILIGAGGGAFMAMLIEKIKYRRLRRLL